MEILESLIFSDIVAAQMSTKPITFSPAQSGWFFKEDKSVSTFFVRKYCCVGDALRFTHSPNL